MRELHTACRVHNFLRHAYEHVVARQQGCEQVQAVERSSRASDPVIASNNLAWTDTNATKHPKEGTCVLV